MGTLWMNAGQAVCHDMPRRAGLPSGFRGGDTRKVRATDLETADYGEDSSDGVSCTRVMACSRAGLKRSGSLSIRKWPV